MINVSSVLIVSLKFDITNEIMFVWYAILFYMDFLNRINKF